MSETSSQIHAEHHDTQSVQSVPLSNVGQTTIAQNTQQHQQQQHQQHQQQHQQQQHQQQQQTQQQRSLSQAERSERSERSGRSGGRQIIQRSSSSTSSSDGSGPRDHRSGGGAAQFGLTQNGQAGFQNTSHSQTNASGSQGSFVSGERRQGRFRRQVIRLPDQGQGQVRQVRQRLPTPEPDTIERVYIQRTAGEIVEEITEIPTTPPPQIKERTVIEPAGPPQVVKRVIRVPPRGGHYQQGQVQQNNIQGSNVSVGQDTFAQHQQVNGVFNYPQQQHQQHQQHQQQQFIPPVNSNVYPGQATTFQFPVNNTGAAFPSQPVQPPVGCHPAFCFYV